MDFNFRKPKMSNKPKPTHRHKQLLECIHQSLRKRGFAPAIRELCDQTGLSSSSTVHSHLTAMERIGLVIRDKSKPRSIRLTLLGYKTIGEIVPAHAIEGLDVKPGCCPTCGHSLEAERDQASESSTEVCAA